MLPGRRGLHGTCTVVTQTAQSHSQLHRQCNGNGVTTASESKAAREQQMADQQGQWRPHRPWRQSDPSAPLVLRNRRARIIPQAPQAWHCALHTSCAGRPGWTSRTGSPRCRGRGRDPAGVSVRLVLLAVLRAFEPAGALPRVCRSIRPVPAPGAEMGQSQVYHTGMTWHALVGWLAVHSAGEDDGWALSVSDWSQRHPTRGWAAHLHLNVSLHATQHACALATPAFHIRLSGQMRVPEHPRKKKTWKSAVGCGPC